MTGSPSLRQFGRYTKRGAAGCSCLERLVRKLLEEVGKFDLVKSFSQIQARNPQRHLKFSGRRAHVFQHAKRILDSTLRAETQRIS